MRPTELKRMLHRVVNKMNGGYSLVTAFERIARRFRLNKLARMELGHAVLQRLVRTRRLTRAQRRWYLEAGPTSAE